MLIETIIHVLGELSLSKLGMAKRAFVGTIAIFNDARSYFAQLLSKG